MICQWPIIIPAPDLHYFNKTTHMNIESNLKKKGKKDVFQFGLLNLAFGPPAPSGLGWKKSSWAVKVWKSLKVEKMFSDKNIIIQPGFQFNRPLFNISKS